MFTIILTITVAALLIALVAIFTYFLGYVLRAQRKADRNARRAQADADRHSRLALYAQHDEYYFGR